MRRLCVVMTSEQRRRAQAAELERRVSAGENVSHIIVGILGRDTCELIAEVKAAGGLVDFAALVKLDRLGLGGEQ